ASPPGCDCSRRRIVTIHVQRAGIHDPLAVEFFRMQTEPLVTPPKDGSFTLTIHQNHSLLAGAAGNRNDLCLDAGMCELVAMKLPSAIVSEFANIASAQSPALAGHHRARYLS